MKVDEVRRMLEGEEEDREVLFYDGLLDTTYEITTGGPDSFGQDDEKRDVIFLIGEELK